MSKSNNIKKLSWNTNFNRIISLIWGSIPNLIVLFFLIRNFHVSVLIAEVIIASLVTFYYKHTVFDWDLFMSEDKIIFKRWLKEEVAFDKIAVKVEEGNWGTSTTFDVFGVIISNQKFIVKLRVKTIEKLNMPKLVEKLEYRINRELNLP